MNDCSIACPCANRSISNPSADCRDHSQECVNQPPRAVNQCLNTVFDDQQGIPYQRQRFRHTYEFQHCPQPKCQIYNASQQAGEGVQDNRKCLTEKSPYTIAGIFAGVFGAFRFVFE